MNSIQIKKFFVAMKQFLLLLLFTISCMVTRSQNLNNPNRRGPMGTQVNTMTGNMFLPRTDISIPGQKFDINISFNYNSYNYDEEKGFGTGWSFKYCIFYKKDTSGNILLEWGNGRVDKYDSVSVTDFKTPRGFFSVLKEYESGKFSLTEKDSTVYYFENNIHKKITRMAEPNGNYLEFFYTDSLLTSLSNNAGQTISFEYDHKGRLQKLTDAIATPTRSYQYAYDINDNLIQVTDPLGGRILYSYLTNGPMKTITDRNKNLINLIYYPNYAVSEVIGCNKRMSFSYDTAQKKTTVVDYMNTGGNQVTVFTYEKFEGLSWIKSIKGNCCGFNVSYEYDDQGNIIKETSANGNIQTYTYDNRGNMLTATDQMGNTSSYVYSADKNRIISFTDLKGFKYDMNYDASGNLLQLTAPGNKIYAATYDNNGNIITSTDPMGGTYTYNYDQFGNPVTVSGPLGYHASLSYDSRGNLLSYTDARGNTNSGEYDILNRLKNVTDPLNNITRFNYDSEGNIVSVQNKNNETTLVNYDASNRPVKFTNALGYQTELGYDAMDQISSIKNANNKSSKFEYNSLGKIVRMQDAEGNFAIMNYDSEGNLITINLPNGNTISFTYDKKNRITQTRDVAGIINTITYDNNGNVTSFTDANGATATALYDSANQVTSYTDPLGNKTNITFNKNNKMLSIQDRNGNSSYFTYDSSNRIKTITDNEGAVITATYDAIGNIIQLKDQNNNITGYSYDSLNRRKQITYADGTYRRYFYDKKGNLLMMELEDGSFINYQYDALSRMKTKTLPGGKIYNYSYDSLDRVITASNDAGTLSFTYDALNRVESETFNGRTTSYEYSISGRIQTVKYPDNTTVTKTYDSRNRLLSIHKNDSLLVEYAYNNNNQITQKNFNNGIQTILQYDFAGRLTNVNTANGTIQNTSFTYDKERKKTAVIRNNNLSLSEEFGYDSKYRLTSYKRGIPGGTVSDSHNYTYDNVGNRVSSTINGSTNTYTINTLNQVTAINGVSQNYDARGNLSFDGLYHKFYDADNRLVKDSSSPVNVHTYKYDAFDRRVEKNIAGNIIRYHYSGPEQIETRDDAGNIISKTVFSDFITPVQSFANGKSYYFHQNELNSVEAITGNSGNILEKYRFDVFGHRSIYDSLNNLLSYSISGNRFGFTGQEYDSATNSYKFYYRNYSPASGIFNQRDPLEYSDGMGQYQYVGNDPANGIDIWGLEKDCDECKEKAKNKSVLEKTIAGYNELNGHVGNQVSAVSTTLELLGNSSFGNNKKVKIVSWGSNISQFVTSYTLLKMNEDCMTKEEYNIKAAELFAGGLGMFTDAVGDKLPKPIALTFKAFGYVDALSQEVTGKSLAAHYAGLDDNAQALGRAMALNNNKETARSQERFNRHEELLDYVTKKFGKDQSNWTEDWIDIYEIHEDAKEVGFVYTGKKLKKPCPDEEGTQEPPKAPWDWIKAITRLFIPIDPNEIQGPAGETDKKWVAIDYRMPYTVLFENDTTATAPAKLVRITAKIHPKHDPATFELGSFGFNNQSFDIAPGTASYYTRLDCRDSLNLFVDVTAGYDQVNQEVFWEFQSIDPLTQLPSQEVFAGFLMLQDTLQPMYGNGFVNFSIKPIASAQTLDTVSAQASIIFDQNEAILTNIHTNTIDAVAPTSSITPLIPFTPDTEVQLHYTGADDTYGSGLRSYSIYVSDNDGPPQLYVQDFTKADTIFIGEANHSYRFYAAAKDTAGNVEILKALDSIRISDGEYVICPNGNISFDARTNGTIYQWQVDNGTGYTNIINEGLYEGAASKNLSISNAPSSMYGFKYRCLVDGVHHYEYILKFGMNWIGNVSDAWENPANWSCNALPDENTDVTVDAAKTNFPVISSNVTIRTLRLSSGASGKVNTGFNLTILK